MLPADNPVAVYQPPAELLRRQQNLLGNKLIFVFEEEFNARQVGDWLQTYNRRSDYFHELQHSVFVI